MLYEFFLDIYSEFKSNQTFPYTTLSLSSVTAGSFFRIVLSLLVTKWTNSWHEKGILPTQKKILQKGTIGTIHRTWSIVRDKYLFEWWIKVQCVFKQVSECLQVFLRSATSLRWRFKENTLEQVVSTGMDHSLCTRTKNNLQTKRCGTLQNSTELHPWKC